MDYRRLFLLVNDAKQRRMYAIADAVIAHLIKEYLAGPQNRGLRNGFFVQIETNDPTRCESVRRGGDLVNLVYLYNGYHKKYLSVPAEHLKEDVFRELFSNAGLQSRFVHSRRRKLTTPQENEKLWRDLVKLIDPIELHEAAVGVLEEKYAREVCANVQCHFRYSTVN